MEESLFMPNMGRRKRQDVNGINNAPIIPFDEFNFTSDQIRFCEGDIGCLYHLVVIEDDFIAADVLEGGKNINATVDQLGIYYESLFVNGQSCLQP